MGHSICITCNSKHILFQSLSHKEKGNVTRDHDYNFPKRRKRNDGGIDEAYKETIDNLKEIKNVMENKLEAIKNAIDKGFSAVVDALRDKNK